MRSLLFYSMMFISSFANAAVPIEGCYVSVFGGYSYLPGNVNKVTFGLFPTFLPNQIPPAFEGVNPTIQDFYRNRPSYRNGYHGGGRFGFQNTPLRYELEISYVAASAGQFRINQIKQFGVEGESTGTFFFSNIYYDFPEYVITIAPFVSTGIGYGFVTAHLNSLRSVRLPGPLYHTHFRAHDSAFAYHGTAGISYNFAENYSLNLAYRYIGTSGNSHLGNSFQGHLASAGIVFRLDGDIYQ